MGLFHGAGRDLGVGERHGLHSWWQIRATIFQAEKFLSKTIFHSLSGIAKRNLPLLKNNRGRDSGRPGETAASAARKPPPQKYEKAQATAPTPSTASACLHRPHGPSRTGQARPGGSRARRTGPPNGQALTKSAPVLVHSLSYRPRGEPPTLAQQDVGIRIHVEQRPVLGLVIQRQVPLPDSQGIAHQIVFESEHMPEFVGEG